jgi:hypothetical protein
MAQEKANVGGLSRDKQDFTPNGLSLLVVCSTLTADALEDQKSDAEYHYDEGENDQDLERHREKADKGDQAFEQSDQKCDYN